MKKFQREIATFVVISSLLLLGYTFLTKDTLTNRELWEISCGDCTTCGLCETNCVKAKSAVIAKIDDSKATNRLYNPAYFRVYKGDNIDTSIANRVCPSGAIIRSVLSDTSASYAINADLCTGCGKCVQGSQKGDKEFCLIINPETCLDCNECNIAINCPAKAIERGNLDE